MKIEQFLPDAAESESEYQIQSNDNWWVESYCVIVATASDMMLHCRLMIHENNSQCLLNPKRQSFECFHNKSLINNCEDKNLVWFSSIRYLYGT